MHKILGVTAATLLLVSCSNDSEGTIQTDDGDVEYSIDGDNGSSEFRAESDDGREVSINTGTDVPVELPAGYSIYPGASVVSNSVINVGNESGSIVFMTTQDSPEEVAAFYRQQAEAAGIVIANEMNSAGSRMLAGESADGKSFTVSVSANGDSTTAQLMVGENLDD